MHIGYITTLLFKGRHPGLSAYHSLILVISIILALLSIMQYFWLFQIAIAQNIKSFKLCTYFDLPFTHSAHHNHCYHPISSAIVATKPAASKKYLKG